jgi:hypothetical protein
MAELVLGLLLSLSLRLALRSTGQKSRVVILPAVDYVYSNCMF